MEKYKEILNKGGESSSKSQQYLDGLLRIPFEIYKKEYIIKFLEDYRDTIFNFNNDFKNSIEYYSSKMLQGLPFRASSGEDVVKNDLIYIFN